MTVESPTQALCDLALRFGEGEEESMASHYFPYPYVIPYCYSLGFLVYHFSSLVMAKMGQAYTTQTRLAHFGNVMQKQLDQVPREQTVLCRSSSTRT